MSNDQERMTNLCFTAKAGESFYVGESRVQLLFVRVVDGRSNIRIRVTAPRSVSVDREKVRERKLNGGQA
jgi:sRNA-binding carbon storage regulator CsrA